MKKISLLLLSAVLCFAATLTACEEVDKGENVFEYKNGKLDFTLTENVFSLYVSAVTQITTAKNLASSYINLIDDGDEIKDFFDKLFNGSDGALNFRKTTEEQYLKKLGNCSVFKVYHGNERFDFRLHKEESKLYYFYEKTQTYYVADTGDVSALYGEHIKNH